MLSCVRCCSVVLCVDLTFGNLCSVQNYWDVCTALPGQRNTMYSSTGPEKYNVQVYREGRTKPKNFQDSRTETDLIGVL